MFLAPAAERTAPKAIQLEFRIQWERLSFHPMKHLLDRVFRTEYLRRRMDQEVGVHQEASMKREGRALAILATALVLLFVSSTMLGQAVNATLLGTVTDSSGAVVSGAKVKV